MMQRMQRMQPPYKPHCLFYALILCSFLLAHGSIRKPYVFLVDGFSSYIGGHCMEYCTANNIKVIETVSPYLCKYFEKAGNKVPFYLQFPSSVDAQSEWKTNFEDLDPLNSCAFSESDAGIGVAEKIQELFGLKGNQVSPHFRDKFLMSRKLNDHGIATMEQSLVENWSGAATFLDRLWKGKDDGKCVVKPNRGVASDNVFLCNNREEVRKSLEAIIGKPQYGGGLNKNVLLQEFVDGNEYAVDTVVSFVAFN